jgi:hypothetical protein
MKVNVLQTVMAIAISGLIAYGCYCINNNKGREILSLFSFTYLAFTSVVAVGVDFEQTRSTINIKVLAGTFFIVGIITNLLFSFFKIVIPLYLIVNGLLLFTFILLSYSIHRTKQ